MLGMHYNTYVLMFIAQILSGYRFIQRRLKVCNAEDSKLVFIFNLSEGISLSLLACLCFLFAAFFHCCLFALNWTLLSHIAHHWEQERGNGNPCTRVCLCDCAYFPFHLMRHPVVFQHFLQKVDLLYAALRETQSETAKQRRAQRKWKEKEDKGSEQTQICLWVSWKLFYVPQHMLSHILRHAHLHKNQTATHYSAVHAGVYKPGLKCSTVPINLK